MGFTRLNSSRFCKAAFHLESLGKILFPGLFNLQRLPTFLGLLLLPPSSDTTISHLQISLTLLPCIPLLRTLGQATVLDISFFLLICSDIFVIWQAFMNAWLSRGFSHPYSYLVLASRSLVHRPAASVDAPGSFVRNTKSPALSHIFFIVLEILITITLSQRWCLAFQVPLFRYSS